MKLFNKSKILIAATTAAAILSACTLKQMAKLAEQQELTVTPSPLELHGDSVKFDISVILPVKMLKKNKLYTVKTWYEFGDPTEELEQFNFQDTEFPNQKVEQPSIKKTFAFPYEKGMETGELKIKGVASNLEKTKYEETPEMVVAKGLITTSRLFTPTYTALYAEHKYNNKEELVPNNVKFYFDQGSAKLKGSEVIGQNGKLLTAFIASKNKTRTVTIAGSHSPEGLESINSKLAENRAKAIKDFYYKKMKEYDYKNLADSIKFETKVVFQSWEPFKKELNANTKLTQEQKNQVLAIVNGGTSFEEKAKEISKLPFYKTVILKEVYPKLRTSQTEILSVKIKKTDSEISVLSTAIYQGKMKADTLSFDELMYAATLTPMLEEKLKIYEIATKKGDQWTAFNNLGATYLSLAAKTVDEKLKTDYITKAKAQFDLAVKTQENAVALTNLSTVSMMLGDYKASNTNLDKAKKSASLTTEVTNTINESLGVIEIKKGNYDNAIKALTSVGETPASLHNLGLAYLLKKDFAKAELTLEKATGLNTNNATAYYLRAITAARQGKEAALGALLSQAVAKDSKLKQKALTDLEFAAYANNPVFLNALK